MPTTEEHWDGKTEVMTLTSLLQWVRHVRTVLSFAFVHGRSVSTDFLAAFMESHP
jgi:hypothetical protein